MGTPFAVRFVTAETAERDAAGLLALIRRLAAFEGWAANVTVTEAELVRRLVRPDPPFKAVVAETVDGVLIGMATVFATDYAYAARPSLELEMLFVEDAWRTRGVGRAIMERVLAHARAGDYEEIEWNVLKTNQRAQEFYRSLGGRPQDRWQRWGMQV